MLGRLHPRDKSAVIIGAGFAGLVAAHALLKRGYSVEIFEKQNRCGGLLQTQVTSYGMVETAAHSFRASAGLLQLCQDLNLPLTAARTRKKYILRAGQLQRFSLSPIETWRTIKKAFSAPLSSTNRTLTHWTQDYLGQDALDHLITPLANGIYACPPLILDQELAMPSLTVPAGESFAGTLWRRRTSKQKAHIMAPLQGMGALVDGLRNFIVNHPKAKLHLGYALHSLPDTANLVLATDATNAATLLEAHFPDDAAMLRAIHYTPMITATVFYERGVPMPDGIGVLYSAHENRQSLGVLFNSSTFPNRVSNPEKYLSFTMMLGGYERPDLAQADDEALQKIVTAEMADVLGMTDSPLSITITRWGKAIPVYDVKLKMTLAKLAQGWAATPGRILTGNYTGQVSLRGMADEWLDKS